MLVGQNLAWRNIWNIASPEGNRLAFSVSASEFYPSQKMYFQVKRIECFIQHCRRELNTRWYKTGNIYVTIV